MSYLSKNIKYLRQKNNLTQEDFGKIVNKARSLISAWESDDREISTEDIIKISNHFFVSMDDLVSKDLSIEDNKMQDELDVLFSKYKDKLSDSDKEYIKFIIERTKKEIDKQLGESE